MRQSTPMADGWHRGKNNDGCAVEMILDAHPSFFFFVCQQGWRLFADIQLPVAVLVLAELDVVGGLGAVAHHYLHLYYGSLAVL